MSRSSGPMEMVALGFIDKRLANHNSNLATPIGKVYQTKQNTNVSSHTEMVPECLSVPKKKTLWGVTVHPALEVALYNILSLNQSIDTTPEELASPCFRLRRSEISKLS
ncbi:MAG: hypothetical protein OXF06_10180 [Bacteroidetes bacterium]|nr:hypothetical protein [Bacteroidota bacterium]